MEDLDDDSNYEMFKFLTNIRRLDPLNPWLQEFCSVLNDCKFPNDFRIDSKVEHNNNDDNINNNNKVEHVMDAVVLFAKTIDKYYLDKCGRNSKVCHAIHNKFDGNDFFYNYMVNMDYEGKSRVLKSLREARLIRT